MTGRGGSRWTEEDHRKVGAAIGRELERWGRESLPEALGVLCAARGLDALPVWEPDDERLKPSTLEEATGGKPFGECSREELLEACRWFWMARDEARAELAAVRAAGEERVTASEAKSVLSHMPALRGTPIFEKFERIAGGRRDA